MNDPSDPVYEACDVEVNEKAERTIRHLEVGEELRLMDRRDLLDGLDLDEHHPPYVTHLEIQSKCVLDEEISIYDGHGLLPPHTDSEDPGELVVEAHFVG